MFRDSTLQGLREFLVVEALAEFPEEELGGKDCGLCVGETVIQDAEQS